MPPPDAKVGNSAPVGNIRREPFLARFSTQAGAAEKPKPRAAGGLPERRHERPRRIRSVRSGDRRREQRAQFRFEYLAVRIARQNLSAKDDFHRHFERRKPLRDEDRKSTRL